MDQVISGEAAGRRRGIQSVGIGLRVLQSLSSLGGPSSLSVISQACDMAAPQVHRYLQSLIMAGMARQDAATGRYDLGPAAIKLGLAALARTDAFRLVDSLISDFCLRTGQTVLIAALGPLGPTIVRWYAGSPTVATSLSVGSVLSLIHSATGRIFVAFAAPAETQDLVAKELRRSPLTRAELDALCDGVRNGGRAGVSGTMIPGLCAAAFPIFNLQGRPILSATLLWPETLADPDQAAFGDELADICRQISSQLGWSHPGG
jgi:DNA-binding IclR family transcriptional regulator